jgi:uncharacterized protein YneF (UPF0154 family)
VFSFVFAANMSQLRAMSKQMGVKREKSGVKQKSKALRKASLEQI